MGGAIISGLAAKGFDKKQITVAEPWDVNRKKMMDLGVSVTTDNVEAVAGADIVILAVKPQVAKVVCQELGSKAFSSGKPLPLVVSIAAGITAESLTAWCKNADNRSPAVVRVMPNTPALYGEGASGIFASSDVTSAEKEQVSALLETVSRVTEWVDKEELIDVVTAVSGSGPAYFFALTEHMIAAGVKLGLSEEQATRLAAQTCFGAGKMLTQATDSPGQLRKNVTYVLPQRLRGFCRVYADKFALTQEPKWHNTGSAGVIRGIRVRRYRRQGGASSDRSRRGAGQDAGQAVSLLNLVTTSRLSTAMYATKRGCFGRADANVLFRAAHFRSAHFRSSSPHHSAMKSAIAVVTRFMLAMLTHSSNP